MLILNHMGTTSSSPSGPLKSAYRKDQPSKPACMLCALMVTPYFTWLPTPLLVTGLSAFYCVLVFPDWLSTASCAALIEGARDVLHQILAGVWEGLTDVRKHVARIENLLMKMNNMTTMLNQLLVLMACDVVFLPGQKFSSLYTLMFLNVASYCCKYVSEMVQKDLALQVCVSPGSGVRHLAMTTTRIVYEWTKAVTFVMTVISMLLVLGVQRGLRSYHPSAAYLLIAIVYYAASERRLAAAWQRVLERLRLEALQGLEETWTPLLLGAGCSGVALLLAASAAYLGHIRLALAVAYFCCWFRARETAESYLEPLNKQMSLLAPFRTADRVELEAAAEDVCAVCLSPMHEARITPCQHLFHSGCLRKCLQFTDRCAICKQYLHAT